MNILHINPFFYPYMGGTEKFIYGLGKQHAKKHNVSVVTSRYGSGKAQENIDGMEVYRLNSLVLKRLPSFLPPPYSITPQFPMALRKIIKEEKPDIIHLHNRFCFDYYSLVLIKTIMKIPLFLSLHNAKPVGISKAVDFLGKLYDRTGGGFMIKHADRIIANSKWTLNVTLPENYGKKNCEVIYNGIDLKKYKPTTSNLKEKLGCEYASVTVSRLIPQKGLSYLIRALEYIDSDFKAVIVGKGPEKKKLERLADELEVKDKVYFAGYVPEEQMVKYYSGADFSVLPSLYEPFGIVLLESMACEIPPIVSNACAMPEVVGKAGLLSKPQDEKDLAEQMNRLIGDERLRDKLGKEGRKRCEKMFSWDVIGEQFEDSYKNYLGG